ncbi:516_t:CDS:2 [Paraglomus brasilianum]|uniref:rhizopuspepsin n=1 Tax=Paraglomus brasilianum TaxID=144538 RepID=A0A9N8ZPL4_9GLOM|nr:516_t:CDS:2 [Paraglomus brasilianum]
MRFLTLFSIFLIASANIFDVQADDGKNLPILSFKRIRIKSNANSRRLKRRNASGLIDVKDFIYIAIVTIGTPPTVFSCQIDTGSSDLWIPDASCVGAGCSNKNTFSSKFSISYGGDGVPWNISYVDQSSASGVTATDTVIVGGFVLKGQQFARATSMNSGFTGQPSDGIIGLAGPQSAVVPGTVTPIQNMKNQGFINTRSFGVWLGKATEGGSGEISFGGADPSHIVGNLTTIPLVRSFDSIGIWVVQLSKIAISGREITLTSANGLAIVDTGTSVILAPSAIADQINTSFGGVFSSQAQAYILPCNAAPPDLTFTFGTATFTVPGADLVIQQQGQCESAIIPGDLGGGLSFLLGDTFLKNNYAYFDMDGSAIGLAQAKR